MTIILFPELQRRLVDQDQLSNDATELTESASGNLVVGVPTVSPESNDFLDMLIY